MTPPHFPRRGSPPKLAAFRAGHVFIMEEGATWLNLDKSRPFALASGCTMSQMGVLTYGSTRETERYAGASSVEVKPSGAGINANGLSAATLFYPGVIVQVQYSDLPPHVGSLGKSLEAFRNALRRALGIGTGSCLHPRSPVGSRRGRIVRLRPEAETDFSTAFAVLLTEHEYSRQRHYHVLLPIIAVDTLELTEPGTLVTDKPWLRIFDEAPPGALLPVQLIQSAWYDSDIASETGYVIDEASLRDVEAELCTRFDLSS
jgi:hypothetical protein